MNRFPLAVFLISALLSSSASLAADATEKYAEIAATNANALHARGLPNDGVTKSAKAYAQGKILVHEYVLAIRQDATDKELAGFRAGNRSEIVPSTCSLLKKDEFFQRRGFQVRYRYIDQRGKVLDDFQINKPACEAYGM